MRFRRRDRLEKGSRGTGRRGRKEERGEARRKEGRERGAQGCCWCPLCPALVTSQNLWVSQILPETPGRGGACVSPRTCPRPQGGREQGCACPVAHSCPAGPTDCSPPGSSVYGFLQARMLDMGCHFLLQRIFPAQRLNPQSLPSLALGRRAGRFFITSTTREGQEPEEGEGGGSPSFRDPGRIQGGKRLKS